MVSDRDRFHARAGSDWQAQRPITYFYEMMQGAFREDGIVGLRRAVAGRVKNMGDGLDTHLEFVNALTHLSMEVFEARKRHWIGKGIDAREAEKKAVEWTVYRSVQHLWKESHWFWRNRDDKRAWHARLQKLEALAWGENKD